MAAMNFEEYDDRPIGSQVAAIVNWSGALLSVLLIAGLATWGWKLLVRDVTGVPVVRALEGPMRVAPEDPGGIASEYQGLAVNRIAEEREVPLTDKVVLAPPPLEAEEDDLPMATLAPAPAVDAIPTVEVAPAPDLATAATLQLDAVPDARVAVADDPDATPETVPSATDLAVAEALSALLDEDGDPTEVAASASAGILSTPRPRGRPAGQRIASLAPVAPVIAGEVDPATLAPGTSLVQLGAFGSPEVARTEWDRATGSFGAYMAGKQRVVQRVESNGRIFYRLRVHGFDGLADARRFCVVLVAEGANCIPVVHE